MGCDSREIIWIEIFDNVPEEEVIYSFFSLYILRTFRCNCQKESSLLIWMTNNKLMLIRIFCCLLKCCGSPALVVTEGEKSQLLFWVLLGYLFTIQHLSAIVIWGVGEVISKVVDGICVWSQTDDRVLFIVTLRTHWELLQGQYDRSNSGTVSAGDCVQIQLAATWDVGCPELR